MWRLRGCFSLFENCARGSFTIPNSITLSWFPYILTSYRGGRTQPGSPGTHPWSGPPRPTRGHPGARSTRTCASARGGGSVGPPPQPGRTGAGTPARTHAMPPTGMERLRVRMRMSERDRKVHLVNFLGLPVSTVLRYYYFFDCFYCYYYYLVVV